MVPCRSIRAPFDYVLNGRCGGPPRRHDVRFMMIIKGNKDSEAGVMPSEKTIAAMGKYNEELMKAGVLVDLAGLQPRSKGAKVKFSAGKPTVVDGPFAETKEVVAGYWIINVKSREEAIEWAKRVPFDPGVHMGGEGEIEVRPFYELEDFEPSAAVDHARALGEELQKGKSR
jgi:hypothetical protein